MPGYVPPGPRRQGWQYWAANQCSHRHFSTQYFRDTPDVIPMEKFETEGWTDLGLEFIDENRGADDPFFLMLQLGPPHNPYKAPPEYEAMYDAESIQLRPNYKKGERVPGKQDIASYYAMVTGIDDQVGRLMRTLDEWGPLRGHHLRFQFRPRRHARLAGHVAEAKALGRVDPSAGHHPVPGQDQTGPGEQRPDQHVDMMPTLLSLCGAPIPGEVQARTSPSSYWEDTEEGPESAYFQIFGPYQSGGVADAWRGVRTQRYMYARYRDKPWVLYDLEKDPYEMENLADDPAAASLVAEMDTRIEGWMRQDRRLLGPHWTHPVEDNGRLYKHQTFYTVDEYMAWAKDHPKEDSGA